MKVPVKELLASLLSGDANTTRVLAYLPQEELLDAAREVELLVRPEAVARVLRQLSNHSIEGGMAQQWASFIRRGYFENQPADRGGKPLEIDYDSAYEDAIVEVVSRLDEIGDAVDGDVPGEAETELLLYSLGFHT